MFDETGWLGDKCYYPKSFAFLAKDPFKEPSERSSWHLKEWIFLSDQGFVVFFFRFYLCLICWDHSQVFYDGFLFFKEMVTASQSSPDMQGIPQQWVAMVVKSHEIFCWVWSEFVFFSSHKLSCPPSTCPSILGCRLKMTRRPKLCFFFRMERRTGVSIGFLLSRDTIW